MSLSAEDCLRAIAKVARKNADKRFDGSQEHCLRVVLSIIATGAENALAQGIEAGTAETAKQARCGAREPGSPKENAP